MRTLILTVGTSLLTNAGWRRGDELPDPTAAMVALHRADPAEASAEMHTLLRLPLRERENDRLVWLHSDTAEGRWCAMVLSGYYASCGYECEMRQIHGLGYHAATFAEEGLRNLLAETFSLVHAAGGPAYVTLCATGGFKAEIAYLNLVGLLLGIDVYYLHEQFRELVGLPRLPIDWHTDWVEQNAAFFDWIDERPRRAAEVESWLRGQPDLRLLVADADDGHSYLTPAGDLLYRAYKERAARGPRTAWPPGSGRSPREKVMLSGMEHHRPAAWERWVGRLAEIDCVRAIRHAGASPGGSRPRIVPAEEGSGALIIAFGQGADELVLRVETTAGDERQLELVRTWIERNMRRW
jgi:putative CRISPR-associated protein (TIGR02619 family)